ncbi:MAG: 2-oxo acid dehydrogenase subunit E2 [Desulfobacteraceae bacterium]|nr:2-oxo acid dehydrogenase subunit E2 [Desulfobacteraceae bacterium]
MPVEFKLPDLGEGIHEGEIIEVLVKVGESVQDGQTVLIIETDKATAEVPSPVTGKVEEIRVTAGDVVKVGDVLIVFSREGETASKAAKAPDEKPAEPEKTAQIEEHAKSEEAEAPAKPERPPAPEKPHEPEMPPPTGAPGQKVQGPVPASPSTRRLARELGVDLHQVTPSGPGGRVSSEDVRVFAEKGRQPPGKKEPASPAEETREPEPARAAAQDYDSLGPVEHVPLRSVRRSTAKHLSVAWSQIPHVTHMDVADITELEAFRLRQRQKDDAPGKALSMTVFMLKAAAGAIRRFPRFNSSIDMEREEIILKHYCNMGVAVDTERGLLVPVIRDVDRKSIGELAVELRQLAEKTRQGKATAEDMSGGTFTLTNVGPMGGTGFFPIINHPQVAILGMAQARLQPVVRGDRDNYEIVPRLMLPLVITFDHRVIDGAEAARFLTTIVKAVENPESLLMLV